MKNFKKLLASILALMVVFTNIGYAAVKKMNRFMLFYLQREKQRM
ncbi:hypothetical protein [Caloramator sp. Dgby_cultured_2]|nr:hypothetical protein [Caloramator sp. Dgby_cultured_2]WDU83005.1 hypothetical protein PWK10_16535 [Caloramator sp. Dgby_cultured_2]